MPVIKLRPLWQELWLLQDQPCKAARGQRPGECEAARHLWGPWGAALQGGIGAILANSRPCLTDLPAMARFQFIELLFLHNWCIVSFRSK